MVLTAVFQQLTTRFRKSGVFFVCRELRSSVYVQVALCKSVLASNSCRETWWSVCVCVCVGGGGIVYFNLLTEGKGGREER